MILELHNCQWIGFLLALLISLILTPLVIKQAVKFKLLSRKEERHIHENPVPRLGGISIYLSFLITSLIFVIIYGRYTPKGFEHFELLGILVGATLIFLIGLFDDIYPLPAFVKLISQIFSSIVAWFCNVKITYIANPLFFFHLSDHRVVHVDPIVSFILTIGWLILITNALNLIDGVDGVAGGVSLITAISLWAIFLDPKIAQPAGALLVATVAGAVLGFLRSNYNPAKIFLGDSGSYFLGFTLGASAVASLSGEANTATVGSIVIIAFSFPLADTCFAIIRRLIQGKPIMQPDNDHIHHRILKAGLSTKATMFVIYGSCLLLGLIAATLSGSTKRYFILLLLTFSLALLNFLWKRKKDNNSK